MQGHNARDLQQGCGAWIQAFEDSLGPLSEVVVCWYKVRDDAGMQ